MRRSHHRLQRCRGNAIELPPDVKQSLLPPSTWAKRWCKKQSLLYTVEGYDHTYQYDPVLALLIYQSHKTAKSFKNLLPMLKNLSNVTEPWLFFRPNQRAATVTPADCLGRGILLRVPLGCRLGLGVWLAWGQRSNRIRNSRWTCMRWFTTQNDYSNAHTSRTSRF